VCGQQLSTLLDEERTLVVQGRQVSAKSSGFILPGPPLLLVPAALTHPCAGGKPKKGRPARPATFLDFRGPARNGVEVRHAPVLVWRNTRLLLAPIPAVLCRREWRRSKSRSKGARGFRATSFQTIAVGLCSFEGTAVGAAQGAWPLKQGERPANIFP